MSFITDRPGLVGAIRDEVLGADCVIVVPPFSTVSLPPLGPHLLQTAARAGNMQVRILYANLIFALLIGLQNYQTICDDRTDARHEGGNFGPQLPGERVFARLAHGLEALGPASHPRLLAGTPIAKLAEAERAAAFFCEAVAEGLAEGQCRIIGFTSSFQQTNASFAMLRAVRSKMPDAITLTGGANCEAEMGSEILRQGAGTLDYVFSGESDHSFPRVLRLLLDGGRPTERLIVGEPVFTLDDSAPPDFTDYFVQLKRFLPSFDPKLCWLTYETSRGCWWGQKHHCTFCGLNGGSMTFREKSAAKVVSELKTLSDGAPTSLIAMADNIMPHRYHATLVPALNEAQLPVSIFYEQKANLSLGQVKRLSEAGINSIQPGIEALATPLLKLIRKGVTATQNLMLLRYARVFDMSIAWNILCEIPGDDAADYEDTLGLMRLIRHLNPPGGVSRISIDRFSPYFESSAEFGIANVRPWPAYFDIFPAGSDVAAMAYHFMGDYQSGSRDAPDLITAIEMEILAWRGFWEAQEKPRPALAVVQISDDVFGIIDSRLPDEPRVKFLNPEQTRAVLTIGPLEDASSRWAIAERFAVALEGRSVPLATASYQLLARFQS